MAKDGEGWVSVSVSAKCEVCVLRLRLRMQENRTNKISPS